MDMTKEIGKKIPIILNRNDIESAIRQFICLCYPELSAYTIDVMVPTENLYGETFIMAATTRENWKG